MVITREVPKSIRKFSMTILFLEILALGLIIVWANRKYLGSTLEFTWSFISQTWKGIM